MADINSLIPFIFKWEGGFIKDPSDRGGATFRGVTLSTWKQVGYDKDLDGEITAADLKLLSKNEIVEKVLKPFYWDRWKADLVHSQSLANILVDWVWCSGKWGILLPQLELKVLPDGIVGPETLSALNSQDPFSFWNTIKSGRKEYLKNICNANPYNNKFLRGWLNRVNDLSFIDHAYRI